MKKAIFAVLLLLTSTAPAGAQQVDSCLCIWGAADSSFWWNPDTVMVDTCKSHMGFPPSSNEYVYSKHYLLVFNYAVIKLDSVSSDSTLTVSWTHIDTAYSQFRTLCEELAATYGGLWFTKLHPSVGDSSETGYNDFELSIGVYALVDSIEDTLGPRPDFLRIYFNRPSPNILYVKPEAPPEPIKLFFLDLTHASISGITRPTNYIICDQLGRVICRNELDPGGYINLSPLTSGFYILRIEGAVNQSFKIVR